jgi:hypothetical protein
LGKRVVNPSLIDRWVLVSDRLIPEVGHRNFRSRVDDELDGG